MALKKRFAERIGVSQSSLSAKLNGKTDFTLSDMQAIIKVLHIPQGMICAYFFTESTTERG